MAQIMLDQDELTELRTEKHKKQRSEQCQCDGEAVGPCPGPLSCPYADNEEEQHDNHKE